MPQTLHGIDLEFREDRSSKTSQKKQKLTTKQEEVYEETFLNLLRPIFIFSYSTYFLPIYFSNLLTYLPLNLFLLPWVDIFIKAPPLNCCHYLPCPLPWFFHLHFKFPSSWTQFGGLPSQEWKFFVAFTS